jgi:hypothetical protein
VIETGLRAELHEQIEARSGNGTAQVIVVGTTLLALGLVLRVFDRWDHAENPSAYTHALARRRARRVTLVMITTSGTIHPAT